VRTRALKKGDELKFKVGTNILFGKVSVLPMAYGMGGTFGRTFARGVRVKTEDGEEYFVRNEDILDVLN
jgi:hypothetical protein